MNTRCISLSGLSKLTKDTFDIISNKAEDRGFNKLSELFTTERGRAERDSILSCVTNVKTTLVYNDWCDALVLEIPAEALDIDDFNYECCNDFKIHQKMFSCYREQKPFIMYSSSSVYSIYFDDVHDGVGDWYYILECIRLRFGITNVFLFSEV